MTTELDDPFARLQNAAKKQKAEEEGARAISEARSALILERSGKAAFFATLAMSLKPEPAWDIDTASTDGKRLRYNPEWLASLPRNKRIGLMVHEVMHCANKHHARMGRRNPENWNIACDLAINGILQDAGYVLPDDGCVPGIKDFQSMPRGLSAEEYYDRLPKHPPKKEGEDGESGGEGGGTGKGKDPGGCGGVEPAGDGSQAAQSESGAEWDVKVLQAAENAKSRGQLPAGLDRLVATIKEPKVNWRDVLREFVTVQAKNDYSLIPPNRRYIWQGLYLPGMRSEELGDVVVAVDTSGSIGQPTLDVFASELQSILDNFDTELTILYHDSRVAHVQRWKSSDGPLVLEPKGGGGTDHVPVFKHIEANSLNPTCLVCLTDMYSCFPKKAPAYPVLWASTTAEAKQPFGQLVHVEV